jgi:oxygen-independent coproporphyrinogen-3 oxidase
VRAAGLDWYEVSNWARDDAARCRHNLGYWASADWWGAGPGAHSHVGGVRWSNAKHPARHAAALAAGELPVAGREVLDAQERHTEEVMLAVRMRSGVPATALSPAERAVAAGHVRDGLLVADGPVGPDGAPRAWVLTDRGRLLADAVVRDLLLA